MLIAGIIVYFENIQYSQYPGVFSLGYIYIFAEL